MKYITLNNGVKMPILGYGVFQVTPEECERCVSDAIETGYRSIDTAQAYHNEEGVGNAVEKCGLPREELFITTKVWISNSGYERAKASIEESLNKLKSDYIDLLLIHQPFGDGVKHESWGPFAEGKNNIFSNPVLKEIGESHNKSVAQVILRYLIENDIIVIPKTTHKERMKENINIFDFELSKEDKQRILELDGTESLFLSHYDPETVEYLTGLK